jgi:hypothetical protein
MDTHGRFTCGSGEGKCEGRSTTRHTRRRHTGRRHVHESIPHTCFCISHTPGTCGKEEGVSTKRLRCMCMCVGEPSNNSITSPGTDPGTPDT